MNAPASTAPLDAPRPRLRADVRGAPIAGDDRVEYVLEDRARGRYFRVGRAEYDVICLLDGRRTITEAVHRAGAGSSEAGLSDVQAAELVQWLVQSRLLEGSGSADVPSGARDHDVGGGWNPFAIRVVTFDPSRVLAAAEPWLAWLFTLPAVCLAAVLGALALLLVVADWSRFSATLSDLFVPQHQLALLLVWIFLKAWHELGHGLVARKLGAETQEAGVTLFLFMPTAFVDVTSAWRLRSSWDRIAISAAGIYMELLVAIAGVLGWYFSEPGWFHVVCAHTVLAASVHTLLFNANPLLRFDGYHILADAIETPNLAEHSDQLLSFLARRYLCGATVKPPAALRGAGGIVLLYAPLAACYRLLMTAGILATAATVFHGAGIVLAAAGAILWWGIPLVGTLHYLLGSDGEDRPDRAYVAWLATIVGALLALALCFLPAPSAGAVPGVVDVAHLAIVRPESSGFVTRLLVEEGDQVAAGQLLCVLVNDPLQQGVSAADSELKTLELKAQVLRVGGKLAEQEQVLRDADRVRQQLAEKQRELAALEVRAPVAGRVTARRLRDRQDTYVTKGQELCAILPAEGLLVRAALTQDQFQRLPSAAPVMVAVSDAAGDSLSGRLLRVLPHATTRPLHPALCAPHGGPLAVHKSVQGEFELLSPRLEAEIALLDDSELDHGLRPGLVVSVRLESAPYSLGGYVWHRFFEPAMTCCAPFLPWIWRDGSSP